MAGVFAESGVHGRVGAALQLRPAGDFAGDVEGVRATPSDFRGSPVRRPRTGASSLSLVAAIGAPFGCARRGPQCQRRALRIPSTRPDRDLGCPPPDAPDRPPDGRDPPPQRSMPTSISITTPSVTPCRPAAADRSSTFAGSSTATARRICAASRHSRSILMGPTIWLAISTSSTPPAAMASASPTFAQVTPGAPASICRRAICGVL